MKIWIVTRANEHGEGPTLPSPYATESAAEAHMEAAMAEEWQNYGPEHDETGERLPYPGDWRTAQEAIKEGVNDGSWTPYEITDHDLDLEYQSGPPVADPLDGLRSAETALSAVYEVTEDGAEGRT